MKRFVYVKRLHPLPLLDLSFWDCELKDDALIKISPDIPWAKCPTQNSERKRQPYTLISLQSEVEKILRNAVEPAMYSAARAPPGLSAQRPNSFPSPGFMLLHILDTRGRHENTDFGVPICACSSRSLFGRESGLQKHLGNPLPLFRVSLAGKGIAAKVTVYLGLACKKSG